MEERTPTRLSLRTSRACLLVSMFVVAGCSEGGGMPAPSDAGTPIDAAPPPVDAGPSTCFGVADTATSAARLSVGEAASAGGCSTSVVRALSEQLIEEIQCLSPGAMARIDDIPTLALGSAVFPYLQRPARDALARAAAGGSWSITSALRTLPQQYLLYQWYRAGSCGISLAASPGRSNHESGLAIDTGDATAWRRPLEAAGFQWLGASDPVHFDFTGPGTVSLSGLSVRAFQRLWNRNHPEDVISEDGLYGPQTEGRLARAPSEGFAMGAECTPPPDPMPMTTAALALDWTIGASDYVLTAQVPDTADRVAYAIDGRPVGTASRTWGSDFALVAGQCSDGRTHVLEAVARDASGTELVRGVALLQARTDTALFIRPRSPSTWEIGLERPAAGASALEVDVDGMAVTDATSGSVRSPRGAVLRTFSMLGLRHFTVRSLDAAGSVLETWEEDFELR